MKTKTTKPQDAHDCGMDAEHCPLRRKRYGLEAKMLAAIGKARAVILGDASVEEKSEACRTMFDAIKAARGC